MNIDNKLIQLRKHMSQLGLSAYIIPSSDPHQSEYVADHWKCREWISGFTGSAGIAIVTHDHAGLWTDSRYFLQAEDELAHSQYELHRIEVQAAPQHIRWLSQQLSNREKVGVDAALFSVSQYKYIDESLKEVDIELLSADLLQAIWTDRPSLPARAIFEHSTDYAGKDRADKLSAIREAMKHHQCQHHLVTTLDDIAWILNLRGSDVQYNPVFLSYLLIDSISARLFVDTETLSSEIREKLEKNNIWIYDYDLIIAHLNDLPETESILIDPKYCNYKLYRAINCHRIVEKDTPSIGHKAVKNTVELKRFREVMIKDGVALCELFMWIEEHVTKGHLTEVMIAEKLAQCRSQQDGYHGESFGAIVGYASNGAIVHYSAKSETCKTLKAKSILLLDSGGQYLDGTTDITRTIALSESNSAELKRNYTLVLKGHISLSSVRFPVGTTGGQLDALARQHLWQHGLNYLHGTGHGVGFFLNVHEGPQGFAAGPSPRSNATIQEGMVTSIEPGYYKQGHYGIRIENLAVTVKSSYPNFLEYEAITLFPIDTSLLDEAILTDTEKNWLNEYHEKVYTSLYPHLNEEQQKWMAKKCRAV